MKVLPVGNQPGVNPLYATPQTIKNEQIQSEDFAKKNQKPEETDEKKSQKIEPEVVYKQTDKKNEKVTYDKPKGLDSETIAALKAETDRNYQTMLNMLRQVLKGQGINYQEAYLKAGSIKIDKATQAKAQAAIAEDGPMGVNAVATRIIDFAKALTNGDPAKAEEMRAAIKKGFNEVKSMFGGKLPDISNKTYDEIMKRLDEWKAETSKTKPEEKPAPEKNPEVKPNEKAPAPKQTIEQPDLKVKVQG